MKKSALGLSLLVMLSGCGSASSGVVGELAGTIAGSLAQVNPYRNWTLDHDVLAATAQAVRLSVGNGAAQSVLREAATQYVGYSGSCPGGGSVSIAQEGTKPHYVFSTCVPALVPGLVLTGGVESAGAVRTDQPLSMGGSLLNDTVRISVSEGLLRGSSSGSANLGSSVQKARFAIGARVMTVDELHFDANFQADRQGQFTSGGMNGSFSVEGTHYLVITKTRMDWAAQGPVAGRFEVLVTKAGETIRHDFEFTGNGEIISYHPGTREAHRTTWSSAEMKAAMAKYAG
ncbi:MAG: hypothetical protein Q4A16_08960 [Lautropia sp.]|nr:hypothetical protein [Lautropia sp.]